MPRWRAAGALAVVTGASSGIGRCLTARLRHRRCRVIAVARRRDRLEALAQDDSTNLGSFIPVVGDITEEATRESIANAVHEHGGQLDLLVNNAGVGAIGAFEDASSQRMREVFEVNFFAPVELTRRLLPALHASPDAVICNVSSVLGHRAVPDKSEYCASKFAMHGWSDSLRAELAGTSVQVTLVSPSTTRSEFFDSLVGTAEGTESRSLGSWSPERVAQATLRAIEKRQDEAILSVGGKLLVLGDRIWPGMMNRILRRKPDR
ncbi:MAG: SDR family NAD(P)-dependent oxidoreductase [Planctomycetota bacterium]